MCKLIKENEALETSKVSEIVFLLDSIAIHLHLIIFVANSLIKCHVRVGGGRGNGCLPLAVVKPCVTILRNFSIYIYVVSKIV